MLLRGVLKVLCLCDKFHVRVAIDRVHMVLVRVCICYNWSTDDVICFLLVLGGASFSGLLC